jgi:hypothetical protein
MEFSTDGTAYLTCVLCHKPVGAMPAMHLLRQEPEIPGLHYTGLTIHAECVYRATQYQNLGPAGAQMRTVAIINELITGGKLDGDT